MKRKFYIPNLEHLITETINQCETCKLAKYERNPVKLPFKETETCNGPRETFSMDIWMPTTGVNYVSCIDRFSKYATLIKIKDRSWLSAKEAMFQVINIMGKPKKLIVDQDACFKNFLTKEKVKVHIVSSKTGLADIERFHGTMNEHIRILRIKEDKENIDEVVEALKHYNHTLHSTTGQRPIDLYLQDEKETKNRVNKSKCTEITRKIEKTSKLTKVFFIIALLSQVDGQVIEIVDMDNGPGYIVTQGENQVLIKAYEQKIYMFNITDYLHLIKIENHVTELKQAIIFSKQGIPDSRLIPESEINLKQFTNIKKQDIRIREIYSDVLEYSSNTNIKIILDKYHSETSQQLIEIVYINSDDEDEQDAKLIDLDKLTLTKFTLEYPEVYVPLEGVLKEIREVIKKEQKSKTATFRKKFETQMASGPSTNSQVTISRTTAEIVRITEEERKRMLKKN
ncbi:unnamed protein product [Hermetia illucens]|uniref:Integrase catalytic domain-containing protein n=1 Tax=Hermetia illucens TaxID=343691 RepID=A0A7R8YMN0_HERIL|nr:unnamed protein product [Hermetia illucens]